MKKSDATFELLPACIAALGTAALVRWPLEYYKLLVSEPFDLIQVATIAWLVGFIFGWVPNNTEK